MKASDYKDKYILMAFLLPVCALLFSSCEEVISVDLNSPAPKLVIEGTINDGPGPYTVKITLTTDYFNPTVNPAVGAASVTISDDHGLTDHLREVQPGLYQTDSLSGIPGHTYSLIVNVNGQTYTSQSTMPQPVKFDSITYRPNNSSEARTNGKYTITCNFRNSSHYTNYIRIKVTRNGAGVNNIFLYNDYKTDGNHIKYSYLGEDYYKNDNIKIELWSIDKGSYTFFSSLKKAIIVDQNNMSILGASIPENPIPNITGNVLGYFCAYSVRADSTEIR